MVDHRNRAELPCLKVFLVITDQKNSIEAMPCLGQH